MKKIIATTVSALILGTGVALASPDHAELEFPMTQVEFLETFPELTESDFDLIATGDNVVIQEHEFEAAIEAGLIDDPRG